MRRSSFPGLPGQNWHLFLAGREAGCRGFTGLFPRPLLMSTDVIHDETALGQMLSAAKIDGIDLDEAVKRLTEPLR